MSQPPTGQRLSLLVASMRMGGAERMTVNLAGELARRGHVVDLVLVERTGPLLAEIPAAVNVVDLGAKRARGAVRQLRDYLRRERPAALLSVAFQSNILAMTAALGLRERPRIVLSVRNAYSATLAANPPLTRILLKVATRLLYPRADWVVGIAKGTAEDLRRNAGLSAERVRSIYNPVLRPDFQRLAAEPPDPRILGDRSSPMIISAGRLTRQKDQATLIRAFAELSRRRPAQLLLLGEGELRPRLEALARELGVGDRVSLPGAVANPFPYMREADLFVLSSAWEGFGNVLVEAMATGTPVVTTDCPHGPREILEDGKWGILVPVGEPARLAEAMEQVLLTGGIDPRARAREFTVERAADLYLELMLGPEVPARPAR